MWIFMNDSFLSIVQDDKDPNILIVRARRPEDLRRTFPNVATVCTPEADYHYRVRVTRDDVMRVLTNAARGINYTNFKDSVKEDDRHNLYLQVWGVMNALTRRLEDAVRRPRARKTKVM